MRPQPRAPGCGGQSPVWPPEQHGPFLSPARFAVCSVGALPSVGASAWGTVSLRSMGKVWWPRRMPASLSCSRRPTLRCAGSGWDRGALPPAQACLQPPPPLPPGPHQDHASCHLPPAHGPGAARVPVTGHPPHHCALAPPALELHPRRLLGWPGPQRSLGSILFSDVKKLKAYQMGEVSDQGMWG